MRTARIASAVGLTLLAAACGTSKGPVADRSESPTRDSAPPADKGPECDGDRTAKGLHVLRGASASLPGGAHVRYGEGHADGSKRTAVLSGADAAQTVRPHTVHPHTVRPHEKVTLAGHPYTVAQICTYRVVLTAPGLTTPTPQGDHMAKWPTTHDGRWRLRWHVPDNGPQQSGVVVTDIDSDPPRATISVSDSGKPGAWYQDVRPGATVEIVGKLWKVAAIEAGTMDVDMNSPDFKAGYVELQELGDA